MKCGRKILSSCFQIYLSKYLILNLVVKKWDSHQKVGVQMTKDPHYFSMDNEQIYTILFPSWHHCLKVFLFCILFSLLRNQLSVISFMQEDSGKMRNIKHHLLLVLNVIRADSKHAHLFHLFNST